jgi:hypothetical protein
MCALPPFIRIGIFYYVAINYQQDYFAIGVQLSYNFLYKFEICTRYVKPCDTWLQLLTNLKTYIYSFYAFHLLF